MDDCLTAQAHPLSAFKQDESTMPQSWTELTDCVHERACSLRLGVSAISPNGDAWNFDGDAQLPSASTAKIPIMICIFQMLDAGVLDLNARYTLCDEDKANGAGILRHMSRDLSLTLRDLLYLMIAISDNTATNYLIRTAGMACINATMHELGMTQSILARYMVGRLALDGEQENIATANDYALAVHALVSGKAATRASCDAMMALLRLQQNNRRIGRYIPAGDGYSWGSKNGTNPGVTHDIGFVTSPAGTLTLAVLVCDAADEVTGEEIVADIARAALRDVFENFPGG